MQYAEGCDARPVFPGRDRCPQNGPQNKACARDCVHRGAVSGEGCGGVHACSGVSACRRLDLQNPLEGNFKGPQAIDADHHPDGGSEPLLRAGRTARAVLDLQDHKAGHRKRCFHGAPHHASGGGDVHAHLHHEPDCADGRSGELAESSQKNRRAGA